MKILKFRKMGMLIDCISESLKGRKAPWVIERNKSLDARKKNSTRMKANNPMKNVETREKVSKTKMGTHPSEETKQKLKAAKIDFIPWNIGKKSSTWNSGLTKYTDVRLQLLGEKIARRKRTCQRAL